ncbi:MAG: magnesium transporter [Thermoanaerobaculia bacterium]
MTEALRTETIDPALLLTIVRRSDPRGAADLLAAQDDAVALQILRHLNAAIAQDIIDALDPVRRDELAAAAPPQEALQWSRNRSYAADTIGRMMEVPAAVFSPDLTVRETTERVREIAKRAFVTYGFVVDEAGVLCGVVTMRDLLLSSPGARLGEVMLKDIFFLEPAMKLEEAMKAVLHRHFPVYPVCDADRRLIGQIRGQSMFEEQAFEISAQAGRMVGVDKEERLATPWPRSLKFRHPWLQLNLVTAFLAAAVVGLFQETIDKVVILAMFLPVLAGQSGNTGCQALAVALRGMTLGELMPEKQKALVAKEGLLGLLNGTLVGVTAALGMFVVATLQKHPSPVILSTIVFIAMIGSCVISGIAGAVIPLILKRFGADPATASSIFLTTATDVVSMGLFLGLATILVA